MKTTAVIHTEPFLTSWPVPIDGKELEECFLDSEKHSSKSKKRLTKSLEISAATKTNAVNFNFFKFLFGFLF